MIMMPFFPAPLTAALFCSVFALGGFLPEIADAADEEPLRIHISLGDYQFSPPEIQVRAGTPVILELENKDSLTPHNFTLKNASGGLDIDTGVAAGQTRHIPVTPTVPGSYIFYCNKKLPFLKSHRDRGMEGHFNVLAN